MEDYNKENKPTEDNNELVSELDRADQIAERQKRENDRREQLIEREEALAARKAIGGISEAGQATDVKEETPQEYARKVMENNL